MKIAMAMAIAIAIVMKVIYTEAHRTGDPKQFSLLLWLQLVRTHLEENILNLMMILMDMMMMIMVMMMMVMMIMVKRHLRWMKHRGFQLHVLTW